MVPISGLSPGRSLDLEEQVRRSRNWKGCFRNTPRHMVALSGFGILHILGPGLQQSLGWAPTLQWAWLTNEPKSRGNLPRITM